MGIPGVGRRRIGDGDGVRVVNAHHLLALIFKVELAQERLRVNFIIFNAFAGDVFAADGFDGLQPLAAQDATDFFGLAFAGVGDNEAFGCGGQQDGLILKLGHCYLRTVSNELENLSGFWRI